MSLGLGLASANKECRLPIVTFAAATTIVAGELAVGFAGSIARLDTALTLAATTTTPDGNLNGTVRSVVRRYLFDYLRPVSHWLDAMHAQLTYVDFRVNAPDGYWEEVPGG